MHADPRLLAPEIPVEKIKQLASIGCTDEEISLIAGMSEATLQTRYQALLKEGRAAFKAEIRGMQRRRCLDGSDTMLIWLGKVVLHQKEKTNLTLEATDTLAAFIDSIRHAPRRPGMSAYAEDNGERG